VGAVGKVKVTRLPAGTIEFDTLSMAVGLALISGALSLVAPYLEALTAALAALSLAGWAASRSRERRMRALELLSTQGTGLLSVAIGTGAFFLLPTPVSTARGLVLAASLVPLWLTGRLRGPGRTGHRTEVR